MCVIVIKQQSGSIKAFTLEQQKTSNCNLNCNINICSSAVAIDNLNTISGELKIFQLIYIQIIYIILTITAFDAQSGHTF